MRVSEVPRTSLTHYNYDSDPAACVVWENESEKIKSAIAAGVKAENARKVG